VIINADSTVIGQLLGRIFVNKEHEVTGGQRKLHNEELRNLYSSANIIRVLKSRRWAGNVAQMEDIRNLYMILLRKLEVKKPRHGWKYNIKKDLRSIGWMGVD
jgi:DNA-binding NtrC family response regulator